MYFFTFAGFIFSGSGHRVTVNSCSACDHWAIW